MMYLDAVTTIVAAAGSGAGLTKMMQWGGKKIGEATSSETATRIGCLMIGILTPYVIDKAAESLGLNSTVRLFISAGVVAESVFSGVKLGKETTGSDKHKHFAELTGRMAAISTTALTNTTAGAQVGFLVPLLVIEYLHSTQPQRQRSPSL